MNKLDPEKILRAYKARSKKPYKKPKYKPSAQYEMQAVLGLIARAKDEHWHEGCNAKADGPKALKEWYKREGALNIAEDKLARLTPQEWNKL